MNRKNITGISCAGIIAGYMSLSYWAAFREYLTVIGTIPGRVVSSGVLVLNFVLAVAIWNHTFITRENAILPISIILGKKWALYNPIRSGKFHMQTPAV